MNLDSKSSNSSRTWHYYIHVGTVRQDDPSVVQGREGQARFDQLAEEYPDATIGILGIPWDIPEENWKIMGKIRRNS